jgi:plasmid maintenance system killer protein
LLIGEPPQRQSPSQVDPATLRDFVRSPRPRDVRGTPSSNAPSSPCARHARTREPCARSRLSALDYASDLRDLSSPGNHLEKLKGALGGRYSIRINDPFRIIFSFDRGEASHVAIVDYHR